MNGWNFIDQFYQTNQINPQDSMETIFDNLSKNSAEAEGNASLEPIKFEDKFGGIMDMEEMMNVEILPDNLELYKQNTMDYKRKGNRRNTERNFQGDFLNPNILKRKTFMQRGSVEIDTPTKVRKKIRNDPTRSTFDSSQLMGMAVHPQGSEVLREK